MNNRAKLLTGLAALAAVGVGTSLYWGANAQGIPISQVSHIHGIAVDPQDSSRLFLATHNGVFQTSADGTAELVSGNRNDYMGFTPAPGDSGLIYASGHPAAGGNTGVLASNDGGRSWEQIAAGAGGPVDFHAMDVSRADPQVIYGLSGAVQVSRDGGKTWSVPGAPPADAFDIAASALDPDLVYAATRGGVMLSRDGGRSWEPAGPQGQPASLVHAAPDGAVYAFVLGSGLVRRGPSASEWTPVSNDFGERILLHFAADPADPERLFAVTQESEVLTSADGGATWRPLAS